MDQSEGREVMCMAMVGVVGATGSVAQPQPQGKHPTEPSISQCTFVDI